MSRDREKLLDKIRKCLRLATSSNEHEAAAAMRQAQKLMAELGVSESDVLVGEASARAFSSVKPSVWEAGLAGMVADTLGCDIIFSAGAPGWAAGGLRRHGEWCFIGCNSAETVAQYAFVSLLRQLKKARATYIETQLHRCGPSSKRRRADNYCAGWVYAVRSKVEPLVVCERDQQLIAAAVARRSAGTLAPRKSGGSKIDPKDATRGLRDGSAIDLRAPVAGGRPQQAVA